MDHPAAPRCAGCDRPWATPGICPHCTGQLGDQLDRLPDLYQAMLDLTPGRSGTQVRHMQPGPRVPILVDHYDHSELIRCTLTAWAHRIAHGRRLTPPVDVPPFAFHTVHHQWASEQAFAAPYAHAVMKLWRTAMTLTRSWPDRPEHIPGVPCPWCDRTALVRWPGHDDRRCDPAAGGCGQTLSGRQYEQWTHIHALTAEQEAIG